MTKRPCKRVRRKIVRHVKQRFQERYGGITSEELDKIASLHRRNEVIRIAPQLFINWLSDGRRITYVYLSKRGIVTVLPIRPSDLANLQY